MHNATSAHREHDSVRAPTGRTTLAPQFRKIDIEMRPLDFFARAMRFGLVGASNTAIGLGLIWIAWHELGWPDLPANVLGYAVGFVWSYAWNRRWTFEHRGPLTRSFARFALVCAAAYLVNLAVLAITRRALGADTFWPHVLGMIAYTAAGFLGSHYYAFHHVQRSLGTRP